MSLVLHSSRGKAFQRAMQQKDSKPHACPGPTVWTMLVTVPFFSILYDERDSGRVYVHSCGGVVDLHRNMAMRYEVQDLGAGSFIHRFSDYKATSDEDFAKRHEQGRPVFLLIDDSYTKTTEYKARADAAFAEYHAEKERSREMFRQMLQKKA